MASMHPLKSNFSFSVSLKLTSLNKSTISIMPSRWLNCVYTQVFYIYTMYFLLVDLSVFCVYKIDLKGSLGHAINRGLWGITTVTT